MTRDRWEQVLFANVSDEVVQDMLNQYVLELEAENDKIRKLLRQDYDFMVHLNICEAYPSSADLSIQRYLMREAGVYVEPEGYI